MYEHHSALITYTDENGKSKSLWTPEGSDNYRYMMRGGPYKGAGRYAYTDVKHVRTEVTYRDEPANA